MLWRNIHIVNTITHYYCVFTSETSNNFIINEGEATAADLEALVRHVQATVERVHGVKLRPEVRVIGEAA